MFEFNDITLGLFGRAALVSHYAFTEPQDEAPVFSAQPSAQVLYQEGGAMRITGAAAAPTTGFQWQKQNTDGSWSDVAGRTGQTFNVSSASAMAGTYRLKAINGNASAVSSPVDVQSVYLWIQNDSSAIDGSANGTTKVDNQHYTHAAAPGYRYFSAFYRKFSDDSTFIPAGATSARAVAAWVSSNTAVLPSTPVSAAGQLTCVTRTGSATLTASVGNLSSQLSATIR